MLLLYYRENFPARILPPAWAGPKTAEEAKQMFYTSLERTGAGYFDFYLLHNCGDTRTDAFDRFGIWDFALSLKEQELIKHVGFSFHDKAEVLDALLNKHPQMEFVQPQINYATGKATLFNPKSAWKLQQSTANRSSSWSRLRVVC